MFTKIAVSKEDYTKVKQFEEGKVNWAFINMPNREALMIVNVSDKGEICLGCKTYQPKEVLSCLYEQLTIDKIGTVRVVSNNKIRPCSSGWVDMTNAYPEEIKKVRAINNG